MSMYVTVAEFKNAPTGIDTSTLIPVGSQAQNDAELHNVLMRASAWVDQICQQQLQATQNTETKEVTLNNSGLIRIHPKMSPILSLLDSVQYRITPNGPWISVPLSCIQVFERYFVIYNLNSQYISPTLALQYPLYGYSTPQRIRGLQKLPLTVQYTYVNGYVNTTISANANGGDTQLQLTSGVGATVGSTLTIYDNDHTEDVTIASVNSNIVTLASPLMFGHTALTPISALPASVKQATILLAAYLIKERGSVAISMNETSLQGVNHYKDAADLDTAKELLNNFRRGIVN